MAVQAIPCSGPWDYKPCCYRFESASRAQHYLPVSGAMAGWCDVSAGQACEAPASFEVGGLYYCAEHAPKDDRAALGAELEAAEAELAALNAEKFNRYEARVLDGKVAAELRRKLTAAKRLIHEVRSALGR